MLRNFLYLNAAALDGYLSSLEDGLRTGVERQETSSKDAGIEGTVKVITGKFGTGTESVERTSGQDTPESRFERLLAYAKADAEALGWVEVLEPETDLVDVGFGALIEGEAEFFVPSIIRTLADSKGLASAMDLMDAVEPLADMFGLDTEGMPDKSQRDGIRNVVGAMQANLVGIGEFDASDWKVAGELLASHVRADVEGPARFARSQRRSPRARGGISWRYQACLSCRERPAGSWSARSLTTPRTSRSCRGRLSSWTSWRCGAEVNVTGSLLARGPPAARSRR